MRKLLPLFIIMLAVVGCARMSSPDGGWFDEVPPKVIGASPVDRATGVNQKKLNIIFDEYIKVDNPTENVIISPPQIEQPEIKAAGKKIVIELKDSLKDNTTYTFDFSDAITDNNEGNSLGNYTYTFSTGTEIDTMQIGGYVINSEDLEPVAGILVGLYAEPDSTEESFDDSIFCKQPMVRVSRTNEYGHFSIKGVKPGSYRVYALMDMGGDFIFTQKAEQIAFLRDVFVPSMFEDVRQDTIWKDTIHIDHINRVKYNHFVPDDIILRAFTEVQTERKFLKQSREHEDRFDLYFTYGDSLLPEIKGLNFDSNDAFIIEANEKQDSITYWLKDTNLVNQDTLLIEMNYRMTDTLGVLVNQTDTLELLAKKSYEKRLKQKNKDIEAWQKKQNKQKKKGLAYDSIMPPEPMKFEVKVNNTIAPDNNVALAFEVPLAEIDSSKIHLYIKDPENDSLWYNSDWELRQKPNTNIRTLEILRDWEPGDEYSLEIDSAAFVDIYGKASNKTKNGFKVNNLEEYGTLYMQVPKMKGKHIIAQIIDAPDKVVKQTFTDNGVIEFFYMNEKKYFLRIIVDENNNGKWDTGLYSEGKQAEEVYYYPKGIEFRKNGDIKESWDPYAKTLTEQKPKDLRSTKQQSKKKVTSKNANRAEQLGIKLPDKYKNNPKNTN